MPNVLAAILLIGLLIVSARNLWRMTLYVVDLEKFAARTAPSYLLLLQYRHGIKSERQIAAERPDLR